MALTNNIEHLIFSEFVKPICLPYEDDVNEDYVSGESTKHGASWVAGWGATTMWGNFYIHLHTRYINIQHLKSFDFNKPCVSISII